MAPPPLPGGLQIRNVTASFDYLSSGLTTSSTIQYPVKYRPDAGLGGSVQVGWLRSSERTTSSFTYTSSLARRVRYTEFNAWNHALSLTTSHHLSPAGIFSFSAAGDLGSLEQSVFTPTTSSNIASTRATFDDLAASTLASTSNPQLASILDSAPLLESPLRNLLYGQRMLTAAAKASYSYSYSPRFLVSFQAGAGRNQSISGSQNGYLIPRTTAGNAELSVSYSLSPARKSVGAWAPQRIFSSFQDSFTTTSFLTFARSLGGRWVLQRGMHGGAGIIDPVGQGASSATGGTSQDSTRAHPRGAPSLAFKARSQTVLSSIERTVSDSYGWGRPRRLPRPYPGTGSGPASSGGWRAALAGNDHRATGWQGSPACTAGLGRNLGPQVVLFTQYAYLDYSGNSRRLRTGRDKAWRVFLSRGRRIANSGGDPCALQPASGTSGRRSFAT